MSYRFLFILLTIPVFGFIAKDKLVSSDEFLSWYGANRDSLTFDTNIGSLSYQLRYNPVELKLMGALRRNEVSSKKEIQHWYKQNDNYQEFSFKIMSGGHDIFVEYSDDKSAYNEKLFYFIESARFDFSIIREKDTISPVHYQFENTYGNAPFITMYVVFEKGDASNPVKEFYFYDRAFGNMLIPFDIHRLNNLNIPKIK